MASTGVIPSAPESTRKDKELYNFLREVYRILSNRVKQIRSSVDNIVAAGTTQGTATVLDADINRVVTVAVGANGVRLPYAFAGNDVSVINAHAATALNVYPAPGASINALAVNAPYSLAAGLKLRVEAVTQTQWHG